MSSQLNFRRFTAKRGNKLSRLTLSQGNIFSRYFSITYYASQLVSYVAKGAKDFITPATPELITALSIPLIAGFVFLGMRRMRRLLSQEEGGEHA